MTDGSPFVPDSPAERLPIMDWMATPRTRAVIEALETAGGEGCARFVGGCVRNAILERPIDDIDIATQLEPPQVMQALKAAGLRFVPTGVEHGTITAICAGQPFEVTTLRRDVATDGRRAVVAFTRDWAEDAQRRDFRLNALYLDAQGGLYDPVGRGLEDARAGRIIFVGDPEERIREDYLRILRFFRFFAWYGRGTADAAGLEACAALKAGLGLLSGERVSKELLKLLAADDPRAAVALMQQAGVLAAVLPNSVGLERLNRLVGIERSLLGGGDAALRLAALWPADPAAAVRECGRLRLSKAQRERLASAVTPAPDIGAALTAPLARRLIYRLGAAAFRDRVKLAWAAQPEAEAAREPWLVLLAEADAWTPPKFPLTGQDAAAAGLKAGPAMGAALRRAEAWWIEQDFQPGRDALVERLAAQS
jgi:poly(A) polymerase